MTPQPNDAFASWCFLHGSPPCKVDGCNELPSLHTSARAILSVVDSGTSMRERRHTSGADAASTRQLASGCLRVEDVELPISWRPAIAIILILKLKDDIDDLDRNSIHSAQAVLMPAIWCIQCGLFRFRDDRDPT